MRLIIFYSLKNLLSIIFTPVDDPIFFYCFISVRCYAGVIGICDNME